MINTIETLFIAIYTHDHMGLNNFSSHLMLADQQQQPDHDQAVSDWLFYQMTVW